MPIYSLNFRWAWQAQLLNHALVILRKSVFFEDNQMVFLQLFHNSLQFRATKKCWESAIHGFSNPCPTPGIGRTLAGYF